MSDNESKTKEDFLLKQKVQHALDQDDPKACLLACKRWLADSDPVFLFQEFSEALDKSLEQQKKSIFQFMDDTKRQAKGELLDWMEKYSKEQREKHL